MIKTGQELAKAATNVVKHYKTLYVMGCFGAPLNSANKRRYIEHHSYNRSKARTAMINAAGDSTFGFDCVGLIKGLLWDWKGDRFMTYGGAHYQINNVPDINANTMFQACTGRSSDFSGLLPGEALWTSGHIGIYIGNGLAVECSPKWENGVQITAVLNIGKKDGYNGRRWRQHGRLPYISYEGTKSLEAIALEVIAGDWGNGAERKRRLIQAGYDWQEVQRLVNILLTK